MMKNAVVMLSFTDNDFWQSIEIISTILDGKEYQMPSIINDKSIVAELQVKMDDIERNICNLNE